MGRFTTTFSLFSNRCPICRHRLAFLVVTSFPAFFLNILPFECLAVIGGFLQRSLNSFRRFACVLLVRRGTFLQSKRISVVFKAFFKSLNIICAHFCLNYVVVMREGCFDQNPTQTVPLRVCRGKNGKLCLSISHLIVVTNTVPG